MAFGGVLVFGVLFNIIFVILCGMVVIGLLLLLVSAFFSVRCIHGKLCGVPVSKRRRAIAVVCALTGLLCFVIPALTYLALKPDDVIVETPQGDAAFPETTIKQFGWALYGNDLERAKELLEEYPELIYYTSEGMNPLEIANGAGSNAVSDYLLERYYKNQQTGGSEMNCNEKTYQELAALLEELGITGISNELLKSLEKQWSEFPPEALDSINKLALLLGEISMGQYDFKTGTWTPASDIVYSFDVEALDSGNMYEILFQGIVSIAGDQLQISDVRQDDGEGYYDRKVYFTLDGIEYCFQAEFGGDWYDTKILDKLNQILEEQKASRRLWFMTDGYQQVIVFFCEEAWAQEFMEKTGCTLDTKTN